MPSVTTLCNRFVSLVQQQQGLKQRLKAHESDPLSRLSAADERDRLASSSTKASLERQSTLEKKVASLRDQQFSGVSGPLGRC